jgi:Uma2 family endonuclease
MSVTAQTITAEQLFEMGDIGRCELVRGEVVHMAPAGAEHGDLAGEIFGRIWSFVRQHNLGKVFAAETGFIIARDPDTVRAPDVAFVGKDRLPRRPVRGFFDGPPDLAVEVISPSDRLADVHEKVQDWLTAGTRSVWVVDPINRLIEVNRAGGQIFRLGPPEELRDEPTLPGLVLNIAELFEQR